MIRVSLVLLPFFIVSCGTSQMRERSRLAIVGIEGGSPSLAESASEHQQDLLFGAGRFRLVERTHLKAVIEAQRGDPLKVGLVSGADSIVFGRITEGPEAFVLHLRVVRVDTAEVLYSGNRPITDGKGRFDPSGLKDMVGEIEHHVP